MLEPTASRATCLRGHALDVISRRSVFRRPRTRAFSITGPYGTGKPSLAVFLDALLGPEQDPATKVALGVIAALSIRPMLT